ncbi:MAG: response regulator [Firmicutes bacterium]|nr:response regulator [Bacillota bacterium]
MITLAIDDKMSTAQQIRGLMMEIDPEGRHLAGSDPGDFLSSVEQEKPDVAWLDIEMPGMNGLEVAAEIKQISPDTNIVFVTGFPDYAVDAFGMHVSGFVLKPATADRLLEEIENLRKPIRTNNDRKVRVQCFGNFEVFVNGHNMRFSRSLSKEAFAYLIDRRGAGCTVGEICSVLWEDRQADKKRKSQCRVIMAALKTDLAALGLEDILVKSWNTWGVDTSKISCDYYDFLQKDSVAVNSFRGEYMAQYSWAEMTVGSLFDITESGNTI